MFASTGGETCHAAWLVSINALSHLDASICANWVILTVFRLKGFTVVDWYNVAPIFSDVVALQSCSKAKVGRATKHSGVRAANFSLDTCRQPHAAQVFLLYCVQRNSRARRISPKNHWDQVGTQKSCFICSYQLTRLCISVWAEGMQIGWIKFLCSAFMNVMSIGADFVFLDI